MKMRNTHGELCDPREETDWHRERDYGLCRKHRLLGHRQHLRLLFLLNIFMLSLCKFISTKRDGIQASSQFQPHEP